MTLRTRVRFAVYRDELVPGWPANNRRILRHGVVPRQDVPLQQFAPDEVVVALDGLGPIDIARHAVALAPEPTIVDQP